MIDPDPLNDKDFTRLLRYMGRRLLVWFIIAVLASFTTTIGFLGSSLGERSARCEDEVMVMSPARAVQKQSDGTLEMSCGAHQASDLSLRTVQGDEYLVLHCTCLPAPQGVQK